MSSGEMTPRRAKRERERYKAKYEEKKDQLATVRNTVSRLEAEATQMRREIEGLRTKVASLEYEKNGHWNGRNKMKKKTYDHYDHQNDGILSRFIREEVFPYYKFPHAYMFAWAPREPASLCGRIYGSLALPPGSEKSYWESRAVGMMGKSWSEFTSNINAALKKQFLRKCTSPRGVFSSWLSLRWALTSSPPPRRRQLLRR